MEISGLPYLARAQEGDNLPSNAVISVDKSYQVTPEAVAISLMPANQESDTMRQSPAREARNIEHPSNQHGLPPLMFDPENGMMFMAADRMNEKVPEISMFDGKGYILDHWT